MKKLLSLPLGYAVLQLLPNTARSLIAAAFMQSFICVSVADELPHVCVVANANDMVGKRLVYQVRELIRKSQGMKLMPSEKEIGCLKLMISTVDIGRTCPGNGTVYHVIWLETFFPDTSIQNYVSALLGYCPSERVSEIAEAIVAETDRIVIAETPPSRSPKVDAVPIIPETPPSRPARSP